MLKEHSCDSCSKTVHVKCGISKIMYKSMVLMSSTLNKLSLMKDNKLKEVSKELQRKWSMQLPKSSLCYKLVIIFKGTEKLP